MSIQVSLGTIANVDDAVEWLSYTYLYIRMMVNPMVYGIPYGAREVSLMCILFKECVSTVMLCIVIVYIVPGKFIL